MVAVVRIQAATAAQLVYIHYNICTSYICNMICSGADTVTGRAAAANVTVTVTVVMAAVVTGHGGGFGDHDNNTDAGAYGGCDSKSTAAPYVSGMSLSMQQHGLSVRW
jgi:hypothetical protein